MKSQTGFSPIIFILVILTIAGALSVVIYLKQHSQLDPLSHTTAPTLTQSSTPIAIETPATTPVAMASPTTYIDFDFSLQPKGATGYASTNLRYGSDEVRIHIVPDQLEEIKTTSYQCDDGKLYTGYKGHFLMQLGRQTTDPTVFGGIKLIDQLDLGNREIWQDNEQNGGFSYVKSLKVPDNMDIVAYTLGRESCFDTKIAIFGYNPTTDKIVQFNFVDKDGKSKNFIYIPKGLAIPYQDASDNLVEQKYDPTTTKRWQITYQFDPKSGGFVESHRELR